MGDGPTSLATTREEMDVKEEGVDVKEEGNATKRSFCSILRVGSRVRVWWVVRGAKKEHQAVVLGTEHWILARIFHVTDLLAVV